MRFISEKTQKFGIIAKAPEQTHPTMVNNTEYCWQIVQHKSVSTNGKFIFHEPQGFGTLNSSSNHERLKFRYFSLSHSVQDSLYNVESTSASLTQSLQNDKICNNVPFFLTFER